jgi:cell division septal protein FtsQ
VIGRSYNTRSFREKKKRVYYIKLTAFVILVLVLIVGSIVLIRHPVLNITNIEVGETEFADRELILTSTEDALGKNLFFFLPKSNFLLLPRFEIEQEIKKTNPSISGVSFDLKGLNKLNIEIEEYKPKVLWCKGEGGCLFVNEGGRAFMEEPFLHSFDGLLKFNNVDPGVEVGWDVIDRVFLNKILNFRESVKELDLEIKTVSSPDKDVYYLNTQNGFEILVSQTDNLEESFENLKVIFEKNAIGAEDLNIIDYIDLRFGNKVFYKLKGE